MIRFIFNVLGLASAYKTRLILGIALGVLAGLLEPLFVFTVAIVYTIVFNDPETAAAYLKHAPAWLRNWINDMSAQNAAGPSRLNLVLIATIPLIVLLRSVVTYLNIYFLQWTAIRSITDLRVKLFKHLLSLPASFFSEARSGDLISRVLADTEGLRAMISNSLTTLIKDPVTLIAMFAMLFWQQPLLTLVSLVVLPICVAPIAIYGRKGRKAAASTQKITADLSHAMLESFTGNRVIKAYNLEEAVVKDFSQRATSFVSNFMRMIRSAETPGPLLEFAGSIGIALLLLYAVRNPAEKPNGGDFLILVLAIITMYRPMKSVTRLHATLDQARAASERIFELLATQSTLPEPANPKPLHAGGADIHFDNVTFAYGEKKVLKEINLTVKAGKVYALVGSSGSGKTTLTNLLLRFYDPTAGAIRIGATDIRDVTTRDLRDHIAVVTQETILFNETIRNNIALGRPGATEEEIIAAAKHAHAHEFILEKPGGYDALIGERGIALSGGQRQRLAIARAILRDAPILILDEATSALDTESERAVQAALEELMVGRTTICIAHRLSTIQNADVIVAFQEGRIIETGSHADLLAKQGIYYNLHKLSINA